jgi:hypothetical protein
MARTRSSCKRSLEDAACAGSLQPSSEESSRPANSSIHKKDGLSRFGFSKIQKVAPSQPPVSVAVRRTYLIYTRNLSTHFLMLCVIGACRKDG